ncbi:MAG: right-handed parallel beta-helix repeat-containing protein [Sedimentisphaerales bacterium]|nr:right-handed parallel beta-helix repeat-containing protein [Sedimentisphaerales bacterium]
MRSLVCTSVQVFFCTILGVSAGFGAVLRVPSGEYSTLDAALSASTPGDEVWVAQGIYLPDTSGLTDPRQAVFSLVDGVAVYGGFASSGSDWSQRNPAAYPTVLSGDLLGNDDAKADPDDPTRTDNCYHVIDASNTGSSTILDGFIIAGGYAVPTVNWPNNCGGGLLALSSQARIAGCRLERNFANQGGGLYTADSSLSLVGCLFLTNAAVEAGGAAYLTGEADFSSLIGCMFLGNSANAGGAIGVDRSNPDLINAVMSGNTSMQGAAIFNYRGKPRLINGSISGNHAVGVGGGILATGRNSAVMIANSILWGNTHGSGGGQTSQLAGGAYDVSYSCIQNWDGSLGGSGNIGIDPQFTDSDGADDIPGSEDDVLVLVSGSPCIDAGDNTAVPESMVTDIAGSPRFLDDPQTPDSGHGTAPIVDMGAYEGAVQLILVSVETLIVPEGQTADFAVSLEADPGGSVEVTVILTGDPDLSLVSGSTMVFNSANYAQGQTVRIAAAEDGDWTNGTGTISLSAIGYVTATLSAMEADNDMPTELFVDASATGSGRGTSWADAMVRLEDAFAEAAQLPTLQAIYVAEGTHTPAKQDGNQAATFALRNGLAIYGGFPAGGASMQDRDPISYPTILSGDLNGNDAGALTDMNRSENVFHVVTTEGVDSTAVLDGFVITAGHGQGPDGTYRNGSGLYNVGGSPTVINCVFRLNGGQDCYGGAVYNEAGSPLFASCRFENNTAGENGAGGAMYNASAEATLIHCVFDGNTAYGGGGLCNDDSDAVIEHSRFEENSAVGQGGAIYNRNSSSPVIRLSHFLGNTADTGGAVRNDNLSSPTIQNSLLMQNIARQGGAVYNFDASEAVLVNCTLVGNNASDKTGGLYNQMSNPVLTNCIVWGNTGPDSPLENQLSGGASVVHYCCIEGLADDLGGQGNIGDDPRLAFLSDPRPVSGSPCVDTGTNTPAGGITETDLDGIIRILDGRGDGQAIVDMGAYEFDRTTPRLAVSLSSFVFEAMQNRPNPADQQLQIRNSGGGPLEWQITKNCSWLTLSKDTGISTEQIETVNLSVDISGLDPGNYDCPLTITSTGATDSPKIIEIHLVVQTEPLEGIIRVPVDAATIQEAIDRAETDDHVVLLPGTYTENIQFKGKQIVVRSTDPENPQTVAQTVIRSAGNGSVVTFAGSEQEQTQLLGLTITGADSTEPGAGIHGNLTKATVSRCIIRNNQTAGPGGGIRGLDGRITHCVIVDNRSGQRGGGLAGCSGQIHNCLIADNHAPEGAGMVYCSGNIVNCTIVNNTAESAGGGLRFCEGSIVNCIIWENSPDQISEGSPPVFSCVPAEYPGPGNLHVDPGFIQTPGNYQLVPDSPCIDAGSNHPEELWGGGEEDYFTELFLGSSSGEPFDLSNKAVTFTPGGLNGYWTRLEDTSAFFTSPSGGQTLTLSDDHFLEVAVGQGKTISFFDQQYNRFYVGSNGYVTFDQGDTNLSGSLSSHFSRVRIAGMMCDLYPPGSGQVSWKQLSDRIAVTFENIPECCNNTPKVSFQIEMFFDGRIRITWLTVLLDRSVVVGLSQGGGIPGGYNTGNFPESDMSEYSGSDVGPFAPEPLAEKDLAGGDRLLDGDNNGIPVADMGAYETRVEVPVFDVYPHIIHFWIYNDASNLSDQILHVCNRGGSILSWEIVENCPWLTLSAAAGDCIGEIDEIALRVDIANLPLGLHTCQLTVQSENAYNSPQTVQVQLHIYEGHIYVPQDTETIQQAIEFAGEGDVVLVAPGIYREHIDFRGKTITVSGSNPENWEVVSQTILDGQGLEGSVVTFANGEGLQARLTGLTIQAGTGTRDDSNSWATYYRGAGIYCDQASPTIERNLIQDNICPSGDYLYGYGAGVYCRYSEATITRNIIQGNIANYGGGICVESGQTTIANNLIVSNEATYGGGGLYIGSSVFLINNTISDNTSGNGGNLYVSGQALAVNNIITFAVSGGGVYWSGWHRLEMGDRFAYNNVWNNLPTDYSENGDMSDATGSFGNISTSPRFVDRSDGNYCIQTDSASVNACPLDWAARVGSLDLDGNARIFAHRIDMGAYETAAYYAPFSDAGPDQHVLQTGQAIILDGSNSYFDADADRQEYSWSQISGPVVDLTSPTSPTTTFVPDTAGVYRFELVVFDGENYSQPDGIVVVVGNRPPIAVTQPYLLYTAPVSGGDWNIYLDGSESYDPDPGDELTYAWRQLSGPPVQLYNTNQAIANFRYQQQGIYEFELVVSDGIETGAAAVVRVVTALPQSTYQSQGTLSIQVPGISFYNLRFPALSGSNIAVSGEYWDNGYRWDILVKDLENPAAEAKRFMGTNGLNLNPQIDGDLVVWSGTAAEVDPYNPGMVNTSVFVGKLSTGQQKILRQSSATTSYSLPVVSGNLVIWLEHEGLDLNDTENKWLNAPFHIQGADVSDWDNPTFFTVVRNAGRRDPFPSQSLSSTYSLPNVLDIDGCTLVYEGHGDIYGADVTNPDNIRVFPICLQPGRQYEPAISGKTVVWTDEKNDRGDIYAADLSPHTMIRPFGLYVGSGRQTEPALDGRTIVVNESSYLRFYSLSRTGSLVSIPVGYQYGSGPTISGRWAAWSEYGNVRLMTLESHYTIADGPVENITLAQQYDYIQHAIQAASANDEIVVQPGRYRENIHFMGKNLTLRSLDPSDDSVVRRTVIEGLGNDSAVQFEGTEIRECELAGVTITGGYGALGGGIKGNYSQATIRRCLITNNIATIAGGGMQSVNGWIDSCQIIRNQTYGYGGGLAGCQGRISNCLIAESHALGGVALNNCDGTIVNCTIAGNTAEKEGVVNGCDGFIGNSIFWNNTAEMIFFTSSEPVFCCYPGGSGNGNLDNDPLFVLEGDYHIRPDSPCVDTGTEQVDNGLDETDLEGVLRVLDGNNDHNVVVDMGAFETSPTGPRIALSRRDIVLDAIEGQDMIGSTSVLLRNCGEGILNWKIRTDSSWLEVTPSQSQTGSETVSLEITAQSSTMESGAYYGTIQVVDETALNNPQSIQITLQIHQIVHYVPADFSTIQAAVMAAGDGDTIIVSEGIYQENIDFLGKNITVRSINPEDPSIVMATWIQAKEFGPVVRFAGTEGIDCVLSGFTVTGGDNSSHGGGIEGNGMQGIIEYCRIQNNQSAQAGGGVHGVMGIVRNCIISGNEAQVGGAFAGSHGDIINCLIVDNHASTGSALNNCDGRILHCTIVNNTADSESVIRYCDGEITNCILWNNTPSALFSSVQPVHTCFPDGASGQGNINADPKFVSDVDFRLSFDSPCIEAGMDAGVTVDLEGAYRPYDVPDVDNNGALPDYDMGAYEYDPRPSIIVHPASLRFEMNLGQEVPEPLILTIRNGRMGTLNWTISEYCDWMSVDAASGQTDAGAVSHVAVSVQTDTLEAGQYACDLVVSDPQATNNPQHVSVTLIIHGPTLHVSPGVFDFTAERNGTNPPDQYLTIANTGGGQLHWAIAYDCTWLSADRVAGETADTDSVALSVDIAGLSWGNYNGVLTVYDTADPEGQLNGKQILVRLTITGPRIYVSSSHMSFHMRPGASAADQILLIENRGSGILNWTLYEDCPWLEASPADGTTASAAQEITLHLADVSNMEQGIYSCDLMISDEHAVNSPLSIRVDLHIRSALQVPGEYNTIQAAIDAAAEGEVIIVAEGTYREHINFLGKNILVTGTDPENPSVVANTIIDGQGLGSVVTFVNAEGPGAVLTGFTITGGGNGTAYDAQGESAFWGAGIFCASSSPTICCNRIIANGTLQGTELYGGGIACLESSALVDRNIIASNMADAGAGVIVWMGNPLISNNLIYANTAGEVAGGMALVFGGRAFNNTIDRNSSEEAGGNLYCYQAVVKNNLITRATSGGGVLMVVQTQPPDVSGFAYNCVWGNTGGNYQFEDGQGIGDLTGQNGNISYDPLYAGQQDYRLIEGSPCFNAGSPDDSYDGWRDFAGRPRVLGGRVDIGAYEIPVGLLPIADAGTDGTFFADSTGTAAITLDGSGSHDPTGLELSYFWYLGEDLISTDVRPELLAEPGQYAFQLIVGNGTDQSQPSQVTMIVMAAVELPLVCTPQRIEAGTLDRWLKAYFLLTGIAIDQVDLTIPLTLETTGQESTLVLASMTDDGIIGLQVAFDLNLFTNAMEPSQETPIALTVLGRLRSGQIFYGRTEIRFVEKPVVVDRRR